MKITINSVYADIHIENEKTAGEILAALETWLAGSGHRLSGLSINGEAATADTIDTFFGMEIDGIETLDLKTSSLSELTIESLLNLIQNIDTWESADFEGKKCFAASWDKSPEAGILAEQIPDIYNWTVKTFSGEGENGAELRSVCVERLREFHDPVGEINKTEYAVTEVCGRLEQLPLDIQTGKDFEAARTISIFSAVAEKIFRIFNILKSDDYSAGEITVNDMPITAYIGEFGAVLKELLDAYKQGDTVLVGDLAEYEMAPRLRALYSAMCSGDTAEINNSIKGE